MISRRQLGILGTVSLTGFVGGCTATGAVDTAGILADTNTLIRSVPLILAGIQSVAPKVIPVGGEVDIKIKTILASLQTDLATVTPSTPVPTTASTLTKVESGLNSILSLIGAILPTAVSVYPQLAPYVADYDAAVALLPVLETWVSASIPTTTKSAILPPRVVGTVYSTTDARVRLLLLIAD